MRLVSCVGAMDVVNDNLTGHSMTARYVECVGVRPQGVLQLCEKLIYLTCKQPSYSQFCDHCGSPISIINKGHGAFLRINDGGAWQCLIAALVVVGSSCCYCCYCCCYCGGGGGATVQQLLLLLLLLLLLWWWWWW